MQPVIIGISGNARAGKDTAAKWIVDMMVARGLRVEIYSMASPLKKALPQAVGETKEEYRPRLQGLGQCWRQRYGDNVLASKAIEKAEGRKDELDVLIIPDVRLTAEREMFRARDNYVITIEAPVDARRSRMDDPNAHSADDQTETEAVGDPTNYRIKNDGTLEQFEAAVRAWFEAWTKGEA
jgi:hypothetical protein